MQEFQNTTVILLIYLQITNNSVKYFMVIILFILWVFLFTFVQKVFFYCLNCVSWTLHIIASLVWCGVYDILWRSETQMMWHVVGMAGKIQ